MKASDSAPRGLALIAVLWLVAALSLIAAGIVQSVRNEIRTVGLQRQAVVAQALADAAILLALQRIHAQQPEPRSVLQIVPVQFENVSYDVSIQPLNGLIDLNSAKLALLADLYRYAGGLTSAAAQALAQATVDARQTKNIKGVTRGFDAIEDLLNLPQMTYGLYAKLVGSITADVKDGSGRVNPMASPVDVLLILSSGDRSRAVDLAIKRDLNPNVMDTSFFNPEHIETASSRSLSIQVTVGMLDGGTIQRRWHIYWGSDPRSRLPWRVLSTQSTVKHMALANN